MSFAKRFPKPVEGSVYPKWEEVRLSEAEEQEVEESARAANIQLFKQCIEDAQKTCIEKNLKLYQTDIIKIASELFNKRASHSIYWKERRTKEKFEEEMR